MGGEKRRERRDKEALEEEERVMGDDGDRARGSREEEWRRYSATAGGRETQQS